MVNFWYCIFYKNCPNANHTPLITPQPRRAAQSRAEPQGVKKRAQRREKPPKRAQRREKPPKEAAGAGAGAKNHNATPPPQPLGQERYR